MSNDPLAIIVTVILLTILISYIIGIFIYDAYRRKRGKISIFLDSCSCPHESKNKRILKAYHLKYGQNKQKQ